MEVFKCCVYGFVGFGDFVDDLLIDGCVGLWNFMVWCVICVDFIYFGKVDGILKFGVEVLVVFDVFYVEF